MSGSTSTSDSLIGFAALIISCLGFGTMFAPLRRVDVRDGLFVQWVQCAVVFVIGCIIQAARNFPAFNKTAAIGGILYATGNVWSVVIVQGMGAGLGMLVWGTVQVIVGWSVARFGLFSWLAPSPVKYDSLNYAGIVVTVLSGLLFVLVRHDDNNDETSADSEQNRKNGGTATTDPPNTAVENGQQQPQQQQQQSVVKTDQSLWKTVRTKAPYLLMAIFLGCLHGLMMSPVDIARQNSPSADKFHVFDFCFSYFTAVFLFSTIYFLLYCGWRRSNAWLHAELVLPSALYGLLWTIGITMWFVSNQRLSTTIAYPITTRLPAIISALLDVAVWKSIRGRRNLSLLGLAVLVAVAGVVLIALSNQSL